MFDNRTIRACGPGSFDPAAALPMGLADKNGFTDEYFHLQALYNEALMEYADSRMNLRSLDRLIAVHELRFIPVKRPANVFQLNCAWGMKFLFMRVNAHIENLPMDALTMLSEYSESGLRPDGEKMQRLVESTLSDALREMPGLPDDRMIVREDDGKSAPNVSLVLGLSAMGEYDEKGCMMDSLHEMTKTGYLRYLVPNIESRASETMGLPVKVFLY